MSNAKALLKTLEPELLKILSNYPEYGSVGLNITLHNNQPVRIDSTRSITMKVEKGGLK